MEIPSVDKREYRHVSIANNRMDVLLISDPTTDKASAACDVHIGQLCDPVPGLAHFCEHMLFIGTSKYPDENAYDQYLNTNGGSSNAFTDLEHTCYYFDVSAQNFEGALDRFAQCFIGPLFTQAALEREVQAVDSEHAKNTQQDMWRSYQLTKSRIVSKTHPFSSFGSGNQQSLPTENIRDMLLEFYQKTYRQSLGLYKLVVLGKESLDELEALVLTYFGDLAQAFPDEAPHPPKQELLATLYPTILDQLRVPQRLHVVPIPQLHAVEFQFPLRELHSLYQSKPTRYISHLIGHEGKGSLLSYLKQLHYAQELYADDASKSCHGWSIFTMKIELTELGLTNVHDVVKIVFAYMDLIAKAGPQEWVQQELQTVADLQFQFLSQRNPMDYTCSLAGFMQSYPPEHYLSGPYKVYDWNPEAVTECLAGLHPHNMLLTISSPTFSGQTTQTEEWYGTEYEPVDLDESLLQEWKNASHADYPELQFPERNDMIATEFDILKENTTSPLDQPTCIVDNERLRLWYKPDNVFEMPKINMLFQLLTREAYQSPETLVCTQLWTELLQEQINEFTYLASMAGLHCDVSHGSNGVELQVSGYHHKAHVLLERIVHTMQEFEVTQELFDRIHDKITKQYSMFWVAQPYQHAIYGGDRCVEFLQWSVEDKVDALEHVTMKDVANFGERLFKRCNVEGLVHGNVTAEDAKKLADIVMKLQQMKELHPLEHRVIQLSDATSYLYRFKEYNESNTNSVLSLSFQMGPMEMAENATLAFLHHLVREPAFNQLRTEEQLGYIVHSSVKTSGDNVKGLLFLIQSDSFDPIHMEGRVEEFLLGFRKRINTMSDDDFQKNIDAVVANFLEKVRLLCRRMLLGDGFHVLGAHLLWFVFFSFGTIE
jgi:insulysin